MKRIDPSEYQIHVAIMDWIRLNQTRLPGLKLAFHCPNGEVRNKATAKRLKRMGVLPGIPDLMIPVGNGRFRGLALEVKSKRGKLSAEQVQVIARLRLQDWFVEVVHTPDEGIAVINTYFRNFVTYTNPCFDDEIP
jgi:hypothetical protein